MTKLSDTQAIILSKASRRPDGLAAPPDSLPPAPRGAVAKRLLDAGLVEIARSTERQDPGFAWKLDGEAVSLRITSAGLRAIGVVPEEGAQEAVRAAPDRAGPDHTAEAAAATQEAPTAVQEGSLAPDAAERAHDAPTAPQEGAPGTEGADAAAEAQTASTAPQPRAAGLRAAAQQVLAAWDDEAGERSGLADAIEALRTALPQPRARRQLRQPGAPRTPRAGTKQEGVLALLRRPEGASGPDMIAATGWAPHTVRGFLAGLKKRGIEVQVLERVRQVGPGREGAKGSYTVYRVAAEPVG